VLKFGKRNQLPARRHVPKPPPIVGRQLAIPIAVIPRKSQHIAKDHHRQIGRTVTLFQGAFPRVFNKVFSGDVMQKGFPEKFVPASNQTAFAQ
jgi:hypothetical protein